MTPTSPTKIKPSSVATIQHVHMQSNDVIIGKIKKRGNSVPGKHFEAAPLLMFITIVPLITFIISYIISLTTMRDGSYLMEYPAYFLSTSIEAKPASNIGSFGLSLSCACVPPAAFIRHAHVKIAASNLNDQTQKDTVRKLNTKALKTVLWAAIAGVGVASFQSRIDDCGGTSAIVMIHSLFAISFFIGGIMYCWYQHRIDDLIPSLGTERERWARKWFARATIIQLAMVFVMMVVGIVMYNNLDDVTTSTSTDTSSTEDYPANIDAVIFVMALLEIGLFLTFMSTFVTYYDSFSSITFAVVVMDSSRKYTLHQVERSPTTIAREPQSDLNNPSKPGNKEEKKAQILMEEP